MAMTNTSSAELERHRRGFTLIETVVTVGMIAVLAAFVIPSVLRKADAADPVKVANDLNSIGTAVQTFASDLKGILPGDLEDLTQPLLLNPACNRTNPCDSTVTHRDIYTPQQIALWKGPYLAASITADPSALLRSGYVAELSNFLVRFDAITGVPELCPVSGGITTTCTGFVSTNPLFVAVRLTGLSAKQAVQVNSIIDGPNEVNPGLEGRFRYQTIGSPAFFLAAPMP
jgi:prepilin-type N-terminal cleavage/methylation domain-containing protein